VFHFGDWVLNTREKTGYLIYLGQAFRFFSDMTWTYKSRHIFAKPVVYEQGYRFIFGMLGFEFLFYLHKFIRIFIPPRLSAEISFYYQRDAEKGFTLCKLSEYLA
jgi:hypothetical protein